VAPNNRLRKAQYIYASLDVEVETDHLLRKLVLACTTTTAPGPVVPRSQHDDVRRYTPRISHVSPSSCIALLLLDCSQRHRSAWLRLFLRFSFHHFPPFPPPLHPDMILASCPAVVPAFI